MDDIDVRVKIMEEIINKMNENNQAYTHDEKENIIEYVNNNISKFYVQLAGGFNQNNDAEYNLD